MRPPFARSLIGVSALVGALLCLLAATPTRVDAASFTVDTTIDDVDAAPGDGVCATASTACSLRAAVQEANALAGPDVVVVPAGTYVLTLVGAGETSAATGDLNVTDDLDLQGAGAATTTLDGNGTDRVLAIAATATVQVSGVTIRNGSFAASDSWLVGGGGVANEGTLALTDSVVTANSAPYGGGVHSTGTLSVTRSTIAGNDASIAGGGLVLAGPSTVVASTVSGNDAPFVQNRLGAGGIWATGTSVPTIDLRNTTISGNNGHGLVNRMVAGPCDPDVIPCPVDPAAVHLNNVTVADSVSNNANALITARNSLFAEACNEVTSEGWNAGSSLAGCLPQHPSDNVAFDNVSIGPLADNGGPTKTHALLAGSNAIENGNPATPGSGDPACEATDQRGVVRPKGARCDSGALERSFNCGDGVLEELEDCDDGNTSAGDGCDAACQLEPCFTCTGEPSTCTSFSCGPCETCGAGACVATPRSGCLRSTAVHGSSLAIRRTADGSGNKLSWRLGKGAATSAADFGDPTSTTPYALCLFDSPASGSQPLMTVPLPAGGTCGTKPCWKARGTPAGTKGYDYRDSTGASGGVVRVGLRPGDDRHARIAVKGKGTSLPLPTLPRDGMQVQLQTPDVGPCWGADFSTTESTATSFHAKGQ